MTRVLLLTDYRNAFYSTVASRRTLCSMDVSRIAQKLRDFGHDLTVEQFAQLIPSEDLRGVHVLYTSSEDVDLHYKSYIEDVIVALELAGAMPIPASVFLRAHHNKSMMEALRCHLFPEEAAHLDTRRFGTYEELADADLGPAWPKVIKRADGAGATQVAMAASRPDLLKTARAYSRTTTLIGAAREYGKRALRPGYVPRSLHRRKFVVQDLIPGLHGDFKVLRYGTRYYVLFRRNRPGDFRASGSGLSTFELPPEVSETALLDYARRIADRIGTPLVSLDVAFDGSRFHLIEFQCLNFGTLAAEGSAHHHILDQGVWRKVVEPCDLEIVFSDAIHRHLTDLR
jgi:hypothetical protein